MAHPAAEPNHAGHNFFLRIFRLKNGGKRQGSGRGGADKLTAGNRSGLSHAARLRTRRLMANEN